MNPATEKKLYIFSLELTSTRIYYTKLKIDIMISCTFEIKSLISICKQTRNYHKSTYDETVRLNNNNS